LFSIYLPVEQLGIRNTPSVGLKMIAFNANEKDITQKKSSVLRILT